MPVLTALHPEVAHLMVEGVSAEVHGAGHPRGHPEQGKRTRNETNDASMLINDKTFNTELTYSTKSLYMLSRWRNNIEYSPKFP